MVLTQRERYLVDLLITALLQSAIDFRPAYARQPPERAITHNELFRLDHIVYEALLLWIEREEQKP